MTNCDFHIHTTFGDGCDSAESIVKEAIKRNLKKIGFSEHSYTFFDKSYCMSEEGTQMYKAEIEMLKEFYRPDIEILCGIEQDYYSASPAESYDYIIGSVHYLRFGNDYVPVDESAEILKNAVQKYFDGDFYAACEKYYQTMSHIVQKTDADIIGHFDLITKFNEKYKFFDEKNERYVRACKSAVDALIPFDVPFEINTGAISRGYKTVPYPSPDIMEYIHQKGGKTILSSDSHTKDTLCFEFGKYENY